MNRKKFSYPPINMGTSFLLVIFIILCMVIFAVLSLSGSLKDYEASKQNAARISAYYQACNKAEEIRSEIASEKHTEAAMEYSVPIDENQVLHVILEHTEQAWKIKSWKSESASLWESTQTLPVLGSHER